VVVRHYQENDQENGIMAMKLVIVGGVASGMSAASQARRIDPAAVVLVLEKTQDVS
jgi:L-2-hydroxyglutarate oxidase LhgO